MIYLDHAATSWPKPPEVLQAMSEFLECAGNPGRSGHRLSIAAARSIYGIRELIAELFHTSDPMRVIFTQNATHALNLALTGLLRPGDSVITSSVEHNSVMRPLRALEKCGVKLTVVPCYHDGKLNLEALKIALAAGKTRLVSITHASNVTGTVQPLAEVAELAHEAGALLLADAAQTAGVIPIDLQALGIDLLAFTGHKSLLGPPGTGGLVIGHRIDPEELQPIVRGGTGSRSEFEEQPEVLPDRYESGTPNGMGIAGLGAGVRWLLQHSIEDRYAQECMLTSTLITGLLDIPGVTVFGPREPEQRTGVVSFTIPGIYVSEIGLRLDDDFGILCRVGLHCAPAAHRTIGSFPEGTVRFSLSPDTGIEEVRAAITAVARIANDHE
jgi:cysteine desulfurase family protein